MDLSEWFDDPSVSDKVLILRQIWDRDRGDRDDRDRRDRDQGDRDRGDRDRDRTDRDRIDGDRARGDHRERRDASDNSEDAEKDRRSKRRRTERGEHSERTERSESSKQPRDDNQESTRTNGKNRVQSLDSADGHVVNTERRIHAASIVLESRSGYFKNMLRSQFKESKKKEIVIRVPANAMEATYEAIKCVFTDKIPQDFTVTQLMELLVVADMFDFQYVLLRLTERLQEINLGLEEIVQLIEFPESIRGAKWFAGLLKHATDKLVAEFSDFDNIFCSGVNNVVDEFLNLPVSALKILIDRGDFKIPENDIWVAVCLWGRHKGGRSLDELVPYIRFSEMWLSFLEKEVQTSKEFEYSYVIRMAVKYALLYHDTYAVPDKVLEGMEGMEMIFTPRSSRPDYIFREVVFDEADVKGVIQKTKKTTKLESVRMFGFVWLVSMVLDGEELRLCLSRVLSLISYGVPVMATVKFVINGCETEWMCALFDKPRNDFQINLRSGPLQFDNSKLIVKLVIKNKAHVADVF